MAITYQDRRLGPAEKIKDSYDKLNQNSGEAKIDLKSLQGQIDSISTADSNASIGVYTITDVTNTNDYVGNITGLTLFDDLRLDLEVTNPNTGSATLDIGDGGGAKSIKFINSQGNKVDLQSGLLSDVNQLKYDGVDWVFLRNDYAYDLVVSREDKTYFVDNTNGLDTNDGSETTPFKTLIKAVSVIPDIIIKGRVITINLVSDTWNEDLTIKNKTIDGELIIQGTTEIASNHNINFLNYDNLKGVVTTQNIKCNQTNVGSSSFRTNGCVGQIKFNNIEEIGTNPEVDKPATGTIAFLAQEGSIVTIENSNFSNKRYGVRANYNSKVFLRGVTGTNNAYGIGARFGGIVHVYDSTITGDIERSSSSGGAIFFGDTKLFGEHPSSEELVETQGDGPSYKKFMINRNHIPGTLEEGKQIRIKMQRITDGMHKFNLTFGQQIGSLSGIYYSAERFLGLRDNAIYTGVAFNESTNTLAGAVIFEHVGINGEFDIVIEINDLVISDTRLGIVLEATYLGAGTAPIINEILLEDIPV